MNRPWLAWLVLVLVSFGALETFGYLRYGVDGTLSENIRHWTSLHPLIPFALGVTVGALAYHFFAASFYH